MINPFDYLFYKVYKGLSFINGGRNPFTQSSATAILVVMNYIMVGHLITGTFIGPLFKISSILLGLILVSYFMKKEERILAKYEQESKQSRLIGNWSVVIYILITFVFFFKSCSV